MMLHRLHGLHGLVGHLLELTWVLLLREGVVSRGISSSWLGRDVGGRLRDVLNLLNVFGLLDHNGRGFGFVVHS